VQRIGPGSFIYFAAICSADTIWSADTLVFTSTVAMTCPANTFNTATPSGEAANQGKFRHASKPHLNTFPRRFS